MKQVMLLLLVVASLSYAATKSYDVVPYRNYIGTQEDGEAGVSQYLRNTLDSLCGASVWIGDTFSGDLYKVEVKDSVTDQLVADNPGRQATQCWAWLDFPLTKHAEPVRGRTYKVVVTRQGGAPISFAYCDTNPYKYGSLSVGGTAHDSWDLAVWIPV
jgi:hypothetical protein